MFSLIEVLCLVKCIFFSRPSWRRQPPTRTYSAATLGEGNPNTGTSLREQIIE